MSTTMPTQGARQPDAEMLTPEQQKQCMSRITKWFMRQPAYLEYMRNRQAAAKEPAPGS